MVETSGTLQHSPANRKCLVYCPTGVEVPQQHRGFAPRPTTLEGKRIGLHWNGKPNGDFFLNRVAALLSQKYKNIRIQKFWEIDPARTAHADRKTDEALDFMAKNADLVISSNAD